MTFGSEEHVPAKTGRFKKALRTVALATGVTTAAILGPSLLKGNETSQTSTPEYRTYDLHDSALVNNWDEKLQRVLQAGAEVRMTDLTINIPENETLNARYSPSVINPQDGSSGNLAVEFKPGIFTVDNALIVNGDYSDVNDRTSNRWAWIDGESVGQKHDIFINLSDATSDFVKIERTETGIIRGTDQKGSVFVTSGGDINLAPGIITFNTPTPPAK